MRQVPFIFALLLCAGTPALAQVTLDLHALDAVPGAKHAPPKANPPRHVTHPVIAGKPSRPPSQQATATPAPVPAPTSAPAAPPSAATAAPPAATLPDAAPANVAIAPIAPPPTAEAPPPPPPISDTAKSAAAPTGEGLRVTFGAGESDLSPASANAIHGLVKSAPAGDATSYNVVAYAAGTPEDPSTARRVSLSRALAVRSALIADGVGSARIYVRALGSTGGTEAPDRVEVTVLGGNAPASVPANASGPAPAAPKNQNQ
jgi:outer membrane protein OmpA-like peptidoglycan-associated protein